VTTRRKILSVVGTRPNMMKIAPIAAELRRRGDEFEHLLVHTGQHYGSGSHAQQTAAVIERLEPVLLEAEPDVVLVPGDVNSTMAAAVATSQLQIPLGHVEAGLRSFDRTLPEELNRVVADHLSQLLFIHSPEARDNLLAEGCTPSAIHDVGNTMIDSLVAMRRRIDERAAPEKHGLERGAYLVVTLHRHWVDGPFVTEVMAQLAAVSAELPVVFPVHPRTRAVLETLSVDLDPRRLLLLEPVGYVEFMSLVTGAAGVLTDSGGIQEETTFLGIPCFTLRPNTERPVTVSIGTNTVLGLDERRIAEVPALIAAAGGKESSVPPLWDGKASRRIVEVLAAYPLAERPAAALR
jgi:UDP-N-acetylglucosamine 2-epimerase (non-hydrolysing)